MFYVSRPYGTSAKRGLLLFYQYFVPTGLSRRDKILVAS